ncbi:MAG: glycosyltransferase family 39 protein [Opitutus sp.]
MISGPRWEKILCVSLFVVCLVVNIGLSRVGWSHNLREVHEFRQTQTALAARAIQRDGWTFAGPMPLFGPPWSAPMEFPLYQTCVARFATWTGMKLEPAGRFISLVFFYLSLPAFYLLLGTVGIPPPRRWLFLGLLLVTPVYVYYSRSFMIESAALCAATWFLWAFVTALRKREARWIVTAVLLGSLAGLVKATTFAVFLVPAVALMAVELWHARRRSEKPGRELGAIVTAALEMTLPPLAVTLAWVAYGDAIKNSNPLSRFLTSEQLHTWNYGTVAQRFDPKFWQTLWSTSSSSVLHLATMVILIALAVFVGRRVWLILAVLLTCFLAGPLLFSNLYSLHDYYYYATGVFLLGAVIVLSNELLNRTAVPVVLRWAVVIGTLGAQVYGYTHSYFHVQTRNDLEQPELARVLGQITNPGDVLLLHGFAWNPGIPYASDRRAIMVTDESAKNPAELEEVLSRLPPNSIGAWALSNDRRDDATFTRALVEKLNLQPEPILRNDAVVVFLARRLVPTAVPRLERLRLSTFAVNTPADAEINGVKVRRYRTADLPDPDEVAMFAPRPSQILAPFGVSTAVVDGKRALNAHAPTEVTVPLPSSFSTLTADYGILPAAYTAEKKTDGVLFRIELMAETGTSTVLFEMTLSPATNPAHRGPQHLKLTLPSGAKGDLVFRTLPGPFNDISFDWAFWTGVEIR